MHRVVGLATAASLFIAGVTGAIISWDHDLDDVKPAAFAYHRPQTVADALGLLATLGDDPACSAFGIEPDRHHQSQHKRKERWGRVKRAYIKCEKDYAIRPLVQQKLIDLADAFTPSNRTEVLSMDTSHSPFLSAPEALSKLLVKLAT